MKAVIRGLIVAFVALSVVVGLQFRAIYNTRETGRQASCQSWRNFDRLLIAQITAYEQTAPSLTYYRQHPDELAKVIAADEAFKKKLVPPSYC